MFNHYDIIDLSQPFHDSMPVNFGLPKTEHHIVQTHAQRAKMHDNMSFYIAALMVAEHAGTHVDSISHVDSAKTAKHIDQMPLHYFMGHAIAIDFEDVNDLDYISVDAVKERLKYYNLEIKKHSIFLYTTGHYKKYFPSEKYLTHYAGLSKEAAQFIYGDCGAINIGTDAPSIDRFGGQYPCHAVCKKYQTINTENLCRIEQVVGKEFFFIGLPLKIQSGSGSPIRAVGLIEKKFS